jgi:hypothetical protein
MYTVTLTILQFLVGRMKSQLLPFNRSTTKHILHTTSSHIKSKAINTNRPDQAVKEKEKMAPLLKSLYRPSQRSLLSSLFTATFLGAVVVVAFPCPIRPTNTSGRAEAMLDSNSNSNTTRTRGEVVVLMNQRGRRFLEER